jgi:hypothetical protein
MKINSKIEKEALVSVRKNIEKAVQFVVDVHELDTRLIDALQLFWSTKSIKVVIEKSIAHVASIYLSQGRDLLEMSRPDRLWLLKELDSGNVPKPALDGSSICVRVSAWQIFLIISQSEKKISSAQQIVDFCLRKTAAAQASLFNDGMEY